MLFSCAEFEEFLSKKPTLNAPTVELTVVSVQDSTVTVSATSNMDGYMAVAILYGSDTADFLREDILTDNLPDASRIAYNSGQVAANEPLQVTFTMLSQNSSYKAVAVANNAEGNTSDLAELVFQTDDTYAPELVGVSPEPSTDPAQERYFSVTLTFDEPVVVDDASGISFGYLNMMDLSISWESLSAGNISVSGSDVTLWQLDTTAYRQYVFLAIDSGAITDIVGNDFPGVESGLLLPDGILYGLYWRTVVTEIQLVDVAPELGTAQTEVDFDVVLTFETDMYLGSNFNDDPLSDEANVIFTYALSNGSYLEYAVPEENIDINDEVVTITQPYIPDPGDMIYLSVRSGAFKDVNGNLNEAFETEVGGEDGWLISKGYTVDIVYGDYIATCVSYFTSDEYQFDVTIEENPGVTDGVIIRGLENIDTAIYGVFDGVWGRITIESGQALGDLLGDGSVVVIDAGYQDPLIPIIANVAANGDILCDWGSYVVGGVYDGYWWDFYFDSSWEKQSKKQMISIRRSNSRDMKFSRKGAIR
jgi:hypothetical protein